MGSSQKPVPDEIAELRRRLAEAEAALEASSGEGFTASEKRVHLPAEATSAGIFILNDEMIIRYANPAAAQLTGFTADELADRPLWELADNTYSKLLQRQGLRRGNGNFPSRLEIKIITKTGEERWLNLAAGRIEYEGQAASVVTAFDITERDQAKKALQNAKAALVMEILERRQAEEAVRAERQRFNDVLETLPAYLILLTPDYHVPFANRFFRERFGESNGKRCYEYLFGRSEPCENCETYKVLKTSQPHHWEWTGPDARNYDIYDYPFTDVDGSPLIMEMGIDITERKQAEAELVRYQEHLEERVSERTEELHIANAQLEDEINVRKEAEQALRLSNERLGLIAEVTSRLLASDDPQKLVEDLCRKVLAHLDCDVFINYLVDESGRRLALNACAGIPEKAKRRIAHLDFGVAVCGRVARDGVRIVAENIPEKPSPSTNLVRSFGVKAYACHPLIAQERVIGTLSFGTRTRAHFTADELALMKTVTDQVAMAMHHHQAELALRESERRFRIVLDHTPVVVSNLDRDLNYTWVYNPQGGYIPEEVIGKKVGMAADAETAEHLQAELLRVANEGVSVQFESTIHPKTGTMILETHAEPLRNEGGEIIGVAMVSIDVTRRKQALNELERLNRTLKALSNSNQAMLHAVSEADYLHEVCRIIINDCGHAMVWIGYAEYDAQKSVRLMASAGFDEGYLDKLQLSWADSERGRGPTGVAIRTGKPSRCNDMRTDPRFTPWREDALKRGYGSSIVLPLLQGDKAFGALTIYAKEPNGFSDDEEKLLLELAGDLAYGITALRLKEERARAEARLEYLASFPEHNPNPVVEVSFDGQLRYTNPASLKMFPDLKEQGLAHAWLADWESVTLPLRKGMIDNLVRDVTIGERCYQQVLYSVAGDELIRIYALDITEREHAKRALQQAHDLLEQRVQERTEELAIANAQLRAEVVARQETQEQLEAEVFERSKTQEELQTSLEELQTNEEELRSNNEALLETQRGLEFESRRYQELFEFAPDGYLVTDPNGVVLETNQVAAKLLGVHQRYLIKKPLLLYIGPRDHALFSKLLIALRRQGGVQYLELTLLSRTGNLIPAAVTVAPADSRRKVSSLRWIVRDIRERKRTEAQLQLQTAAMQAAANGITITDRAGVIQWCNPAFLKMTGYSQTQIIGKSHRIIGSGQQSAHFYQDLWATILSGKTWHGEIVNRRKNGSLYTEEQTITPLVGDSGEITHFIAIKQDITERKQAETAIRENAARSAALSDLSKSLAEAGLDEKAILEIVVNAAAQMIGDGCIIALASQDSQWLEPAAWHHNRPEALERMTALMQSVRRRANVGLAGKVFSTSESILTHKPRIPGGKIGHSPVTQDFIQNVGISGLIITPLQIGGKTTGVLALIRDSGSQPYAQEDKTLADILANRTAQAIQHARLYQDLQNALRQEQEMHDQLMQVEKLAVAGRMLASITHEINNPLQTIENCLYLIREDTPDDAPISQLLGMASSEAKRLSGLVEQLRQIYRPPAREQRRGVNLPALLADVKALLASHLREKGVKWELALPEAEQLTRNSVTGVPDQLKQVFLNLSLNAVDAMQPQGGRLMVDLMISTDGSQTGVRFKDTGPGMAPEMQARIFEPFFTTKEKGLGLGLSICYDIVRRHNGRIEVQSQPGEGAAFTVWLPVKKVSK